MPTTKTVEKLAQIAKRRAEENEKEDDLARRKIAKEIMQDDMKKGGAAAHRAVTSALEATKRNLSNPPIPSKQTRA